MPRNYKVGIDYFSHDVDMASDRKIKLLKAKHGIIGYAIYLRLLEELYRDKGYYLYRDEEFDLLFANDNNIDINVYINVINECIAQELFNKKLYNDYSILTSKRIQSNYLEACRRRKLIDLTKEYLLVKPSDVLGDNHNINVNINSINANKSTQRKGKESKVKESKEDTSSKHDNIPFKEIVNYLNEKTGKNFRHSTKKTKDLIIARYNEDFTLDDFKKVIDVKSAEWKNDKKQNKFLRPETLFGTKFEGYLNQNMKNAFMTDDEIDNILGG